MAGYRPRTRKDTFYKRGRDILYVAEVFTDAPQSAYRSPKDWYMTFVGTLTDVGVDGPSSGTQPVVDTRHIYELDSKFKKIKASDLKPAWRAFFRRALKLYGVTSEALSELRENPRSMSYRRRRR